MIRKMMFFIDRRIKGKQNDRKCFSSNIKDFKMSITADQN